MIFESCKRASARPSGTKADDKSLNVAKKISVDNTAEQKEVEKMLSELENANEYFETEYNLK